MIALTYKSIKPYLSEETQQGDRLYCTFLIEETTFESDVVIERVTEEKNLRSMVKNPSKMRSILLRALTKRSSKKEAVGEETISFSKGDLEAAAVRAFEQITNEIVYIETTDKWHLATQFSAFEVYIRQNPLTERYDKKIMSRMLVEMARADGRIEEKERLFFEHFLNQETGRLSDLMRAPFLTALDCEKVTKKGRPTVFVIVAAVALTDNIFAETEKAKLDHFARLFGFSENEQKALFAIAQAYTLEIGIKTSHRKMTKTALHRLAGEIGMDQATAEQIQARLERLSEA